MSKTLDKKLFAKNLSYLRTKKKMTQSQLADELEVSQVSVSQWEKGLKAPQNFGLLKHLSELFDVSADDLLFTDLKLEELTKITALQVDNSEKEKNPYRITIYGKVCAGDGFEAFEDPIDEIGDPYPQIKEELFGLKVKGDSMDRVVADGMYAIFQQQQTVRNGEIAVIMIDNDLVMLKRFYKINQSTVVLEPESHNPNHTPMLFHKEDINRLKIIGKYIGCVSPLETYGNIA